MSRPVGATVLFGAVCGLTVMPLVYVNTLLAVTVPPVVVTASANGPPATCGGTVAVKFVPRPAVTLPTTMLDSGAPPRVAVMPVAGKLAPLTVMVEPPCAGPVPGD